MIIKTAHKVAIASIASRAVRCARRLAGLGPTARVRRRGVDWWLDLREGIDFSIYLLGAFEPRTVRAYERLVKEGYIVLDIGANIGAHTLPLARLVGETGRVIAFEPTAFAFDKLRENVALNPSLAGRILPLQRMLVAAPDDLPAEEVYSSWPLSNDGPRHSKHMGRPMTTAGATAATLDGALREFGVGRVDFIKIDVDGHELPVLRGATETLERSRPTVLIELSPYVHGEEGYSFDELVLLLTRRGYSFRDVNSGRALPGKPDELRQLIPDGAGINAVAMVT